MEVKRLLDKFTTFMLLTRATDDEDKEGQEIWSNRALLILRFLQGNATITFGLLRKHEPY